MAVRAEIKPVLSPNLFSFEHRPTEKIRAPLTCRVPKLESLACKFIALTDGLDLTKLTEKYRAVLLFNTLKYNIKTGILKILLTWPSRNFKLENESCKSFIKAFDESVPLASFAPSYWSKYLSLLSCCFMEVIYEGKALQLQNLDIQCFPYIFAPHLSLFESFPIVTRLWYSEEHASEEDKSSKCFICLNVHVKNTESVHDLLQILKRKDFCFKVNSVRFDFSQMTPKDMTIGNIQTLKELCQKLCINPLQGIEVTFAAGANFFFKKMITNLFHDGIFQSVTSLNLVKYVCTTNGIIEFMNYATLLCNLKSLSISHSALMTRALAVVDCFSSLTTLRLVKVGLSEHDLFLLKNYEPLEALEHFDISYNKLCQVDRTYGFCKLLDRWKSNLKTLESRHIQWLPEHFDYLDQECIAFEKMERVNLSGNSISTGYLESLLRVRSLKHIMCDDPTLEEKIFEYKDRIDLAFVRNRCILTPFDRPFFEYL